jgi:hypothetical protein
MLYFNQINWGLRVTAFKDNVDNVIVAIFASLMRDVSFNWLILLIRLILLH